MAHSNPFYEVNSDDNDGILAIVAIAGSLLTTLTILLRFFILRRVSALKDYDYVLLLAFVLLLAQTALSMYTLSLGLGKHQDEVQEESQDTIRKVEYIIWLFSVVVVAATKLCICLFIRAINNFSHIRTANNILLVLGAACFLAIFLATAFRCPLPSPWLSTSTESCPAAGPIYWCMMGANIATDALVLLLAALMVVKVQTDVRTKAVVIGLFSSRILCPGTTIPALTQPLHVYNGEDSDFTRLGLMPLVWLTATCHLSVITACVPTLKPLFDSLLGNTMALKIDGLYELRERDDGLPGFKVTEITESSQATDNNNNNSGGSGAPRSRPSSKTSGNTAPRSRRSEIRNPRTRHLDPNGGEDDDDVVVLPAEHLPDTVTIRRKSGLKLTPDTHTLDNKADCFSDHDDINNDNNYYNNHNGGKARRYLPRRSTSKRSIINAATAAGVSRHQSHKINTNDEEDDEERDQSDSVKGLMTDGVIMIRDDIEVRFDEHHDGRSSCYSSGD